MSIWTHVNTVFRIDSVYPHLEEKNKIKRIIGKTCIASSPAEEWEKLREHPEEYSPRGSEGTLQMAMWENPNRHCTAAYVVTVFGDLRDVDLCQKVEQDKIISWFMRCCKELDIRQATMTAECDSGVIIVANPNNNNGTPYVESPSVQIYYQKKNAAYCD